MKHYTAKKDELVRHISQLPNQLGVLANKIASENPGIEKNFRTAQGLVYQHIKALTDQAGPSISKFASENPGIETSFRTAQDVVSQHIKQLPGQVRLLAGKYDPKDIRILADPHLKTVLIITGATVAGAIIVPVAVAAFGFSTGGVVAGSAAAGIQSGIGNVAAGSAFAIMQSAGTAPLLLATIGAAVGATGGTAVVVTTKAGDMDDGGEK